jgi:hypothetical protein
MISSVYWKDKDTVNMPKLNLPEYELKLRSGEGRTLVLDPFRKKYVVLTPEEEVRQRFARFLVEEKGYPGSLIQTEHTLTLNEWVRRCDILVHKPAGTPAVLVECKAPSVGITQATFDQAARYNRVFRVSYLMVTNGLKHYCCKIEYNTGSIKFLPDIPSYTEI